ncbi:MAG: imidazole glycerol phosphate synthase cyclase subunit [Alphaproteobacteria bacterium]|nr:imidazole glycerol phosphate synthase cyclase subunit [Alphaproteobacteria bacterium]
MVKIRVIPLLLLKDGMLKKPMRFIERPRTVANPISIIRVFESRQVDELILLDIGCAAHNANVNPDIVRMASEELTVPFTCGGGIRSVDAMGELIAAGAEKVVINTAAVETPELITTGADKFGRQCIVVSIDAKRHDDGNYEVFTRNGTHSTGLEPRRWAREAQERGAGEILINAIDRDGTMEGYDIGLIRAVSGAVEIPVIAAGGAGELHQFAEAVIKGGAAAVAAGSIYHFRRTTPDMVKGAMHSSGVPVRLTASVH